MFRTVVVVLSLWASASGCVSLRGDDPIAARMAAGFARPPHAPSGASTCLVAPR
jgi:hypothetical protein